MGFTISKTVSKCGYYPSLGIQEPSTDVTVDITYEVSGINSLYGPLGIATYQVSTADSVVSGEIQFEFEWSGSGDPLKEAEQWLEASMR
ncbi:hypothetical protein [Raoultella ornithinolytica]|uniref:hypothetical protein n=1 Tax=Raoultella ornithinolytica TaxID=54291 RepID=UPI001BCBD97E|nr:hypothetical protein [Raoultella ornithinolytica]